MLFAKIVKIKEGSLDSIPSLSPSMKILIVGGKVCLRCKGKKFEFSLKVKVMGSNPGYLLKSFLPYFLQRNWWSFLQRTPKGDTFIQIQLTRTLISSGPTLLKPFSTLGIGRTVSSFFRYTLVDTWTLTKESSNKIRKTQNEHLIIV